MNWWIWAAAGLLLLGLELATPGSFFIFFFGLGAFAAAAAAAAGATGLPAQLGVFAVVSAASLLLLRAKLVQKFSTRPELQKSLGDLVGGVAVALEDIAPGAQGRAEYRGTPWAARNAGSAAIKAGGRCRIESVDGLTILVRPE
jgi:inner membrane protein